MAEPSLLLEFLDVGEARLRVIGTWRGSAAPPRLFAALRGESRRAEAAFAGSGFEVCVGIGADGAEIGFFVDGPVGEEPVRSFATGPYFPMHEDYSRSYCVRGGWIFSWRGCAIRMERASAAGVVGMELAFWRELWSKNLVGGRKAVALRLAACLWRLFSRRPFIVVSDRMRQADDNGEAFFEFLRRRRVAARAWFVLSRGSRDWRRVARLGTVVEPFSLKHKLALLAADYAVSSQADKAVHSPFNGWESNYRDMLNRKRFVFLQHGVTKDDVSGWLNRRSMNVYGFVTSSARERRALLDGGLGYGEDSVWLTGMPRMDLLSARPSRLVLVMPTWRRPLVEAYDAARGCGRSSPRFRDSAYFKFYHSLLSDERLCREAGRMGYEIAYLPHPQFRGEDFSVSPGAGVRVLDGAQRYCDLISSAAMLVTDYSSVAFDFAYMRKPVLYAQFDETEFFDGSHVYERGYFDYRRDGFGEVVSAVGETVDAVLRCLGRGCVPEDAYLRRMEGFFAYGGGGNCRRVYESMRMRDGSLPPLPDARDGEAGDVP